MDIEVARQYMIERQIRPSNVSCTQVVEALYHIPREAFVLDSQQNLAFVDMMLPLKHGQYMLTPQLEARMLQAAALKPQDLVLEVGTGSGYFTALLSHGAKHVYSVDVHKAFTEQAQEAHKKLNIHNTTFETGNALASWDTHAPYDCIILTGSTEHLPQSLYANLNPQGRLVAILGSGECMQVIVDQKTDEHYIKRTTLLETKVPPLVGATSPSQFKL